MKFRNNLAVFGAIVLMSVGVSSSAQNRPDCVEDPDKPGACFDSTTTSGQVWCNYLDDQGIVVWFGDFPGIEPEKNGFTRTDPNGKIFDHHSVKEIAMGFCTWGDQITGGCGTTEEPGDAAYRGIGSAKINGYVNEFGQAQCPFRGQAKGTLSRPLDSTMVEINADLHIVPDRSSPNGCRVKTCRIIAPN